MSFLYVAIYQLENSFAFEIESASGNSACFCSCLSQLSFLEPWGLWREKSIETLPLHCPRTHAHFVPVSTLQPIAFVTRKQGGIWGIYSFLSVGFHLLSQVADAGQRLNVQRERSIPTAALQKTCLSYPPSSPLFPSWPSPGSFSPLLLPCFFLPSFSP